MTTLDNNNNANQEANYKNIDDYTSKQSETNGMPNIMAMMMRTSESPLEQAMLPRAYGDDSGTSKDNFEF